MVKTLARRLSLASSSLPSRVPFLPAADLAPPSMGWHRARPSLSCCLLLSAKQEEARGAAMRRCCRPRAAEHGCPSAGDEEEREMEAAELRQPPPSEGLHCAAVHHPPFPSPLAHLYGPRGRAEHNVVQQAQQKFRAVLLLFASLSSSTPNWRSTSRRKSLPRGRAWSQGELPPTLLFHPILAPSYLLLCSSLAPHFLLHIF